MQQQLFVLCITPSLQIFHLRRHCQGGVYTVFLLILSKKTKLLSFLVEFIEMWTKIKKTSIILDSGPDTQICDPICSKYLQNSEL